MTTDQLTYRIDITDYGAIGDGEHLNTTAIQQALDAIGEQGGGTVFVPPGTYVTGTLFLRSGTSLELHPAARILGSANLDDYITKSWGQHIDRTPWHLLVADGIRDVTICGGGTIDGNGPAFWEECVPAADAVPSTVPGAFAGLDPITAVPARHADARKAPIAWIRANKEKRPSPMLEITNCENVRVQDVTITNSAGWLLHLHNCNFVWIRGVKLFANLMGPNNDGFDITGCHDVMVSDCHLSCCDDAICLKTTPDSQTIERVTVTNCIIRTKCVALKLGCAESDHDFKQVTFSNCVVYESSRAFGLYAKRGGAMEDITVSNIVCDTQNAFMMNRPIHIMSIAENERPAGKIRNVLIQNVVCRTDGRVLITGTPEVPVENVVIRDLQMTYPTIDDPELTTDRIPCAQFPGQSNPEAAFARGVVVAENVINLVVDNLMVTWPTCNEAGEILCPDEWAFPLKACNGVFDEFFERADFSTGRIPPFHLVWARAVQGGYISAPVAKPAPEQELRYALTDSDILIRD